MLANSATRYGSAARALHWLTALLILSAIALGLYAESLPRDTEAAAAALRRVYSAHKTIGVATFFVALIRILWAWVQPKPAPLHPERRAETLAAEVVHWALYGAMLVMPASGWVMHAAEAGFAPILWPFGQGLPFVPKSEALAHAAGAVHKTAVLVLYGALAAHVAGALKHALIDRDATLARMLRGTAAGPVAGPAAGTGPTAGHGIARLAPVAALGLWAGVLGVALLPDGGAAPLGADATPAAAPTSAAASGWQVREGQLGFTVTQMGAPVTGALPNWTAAIDYDPETGAGHVEVQIDTTTLSLGSVTDQAKGADFFDTATHPGARFTATITRIAGAEHAATGTLTLRGTAVPLTLPFTLTVAGETATMTGQVTLDRRAFGMGAAFPDEATVGFGVTVDVALSATRPAG